MSHPECDIAHRWRMAPATIVLLPRGKRAEAHSQTVFRPQGRKDGLTPLVVSSSGPPPDRGGPLPLAPPPTGRAGAAAAARRQPARRTADSVRNLTPAF